MNKTPQNKPLQIALIGSPNAGKTTLFNRLTGTNQTTGNWPGVTVEKKVGRFKIHKRPAILTDLPGVYSLENSARSGLDEKVAREFLQSQAVDILINVVDANCLERQLFLTAQLLHMGLPVVVALNRTDQLTANHLKIDVQKLSEKLGCPVFPMSAYTNSGVADFKQKLPGLVEKRPALHLDLPEKLHESIHAIYDQLPNNQAQDTCWKALHFLMNPKMAPAHLQTLAEDHKQQLESHYQEDLVLISADLYFQFAHEATHLSLTRTDSLKRNTTDQIDKWVLHPLLGMPIFLLVMYFMFATSITLGNLFLDFFDQAAQALFVEAPADLMADMKAPSWLITLLAEGIGGGLQVVATFIPVIGALFLVLSVLEESGYMQRAAFIMDRSMRKLGLSGQAFIPLVVGLGCNIPAVLASRTLPDPKVRIMTTMMTPFMSCSARLTVYVLFATAFFSDHATLLVFSLYLIGILAAILTALLLKHTLLKGESQSLLMELPTYNKPALTNIVLNTHNKMKGFLFGAGKIIVIVVLLINFFNSLGTDGSFGHHNQNVSILSQAAQMATPVVEPLGITEDNWPATVGIITGVLAKEVVVGALDNLYHAMDHSSSPPQPESPLSLTEKLVQAAGTIPENGQRFIQDLLDPIGLGQLETINNPAQSSAELSVATRTLDRLVNHFDGAAGAYAYLLLILLYFPCVATFAAIRSELGWRWALSSAGWSLFLGYSTSVSFYQTLTFNQHPITATAWLTGFGLAYITLFFVLKRLGTISSTRTLI